MSRRKLPYLFISLISLALLIGVVALSSPVAQAPPGGLTVTVANTPLPIVGDVNISNAPDVHVANDVTNPVPVRDVDHPARGPVSASKRLIVPDGATTRLVTRASFSPFPRTSVWS